jgi:phage gp16-like protein
MGKQVFDSEPNQTALFRWIKKQQEEKEAHQLTMANQKYQEDKDCYLKHLVELIQEWRHIKIKEKIIIMNFVKHHEAQRNFSTGQRSLIMGLYMKYCLKV